jgi:hypothetical protein
MINRADEAVRALFDAFIAAQNTHDETAVGKCILESPEFLWITTTRALHGHAAAMQQFRHVYGGTYRLDPRMSDFRVVAITEHAAQLFVPVDLTIGAPGEIPRAVPFMLHQSVVRTADGWRIASIMPVKALA